MRDYQQDYRGKLLAEVQSCAVRFSRRLDAVQIDA